MNKITVRRLLSSLATCALVAVLGVGLGADDARSRDAAILTVYGVVKTETDVTFDDPGYEVVVTNTRNGAEVRSPLSVSVVGGYDATFVDTENSLAAQEGDVLAFRVESGDGNFVYTFADRTLTTDEANGSLVRVDLVIAGCTVSGIEPEGDLSPGDQITVFGSDFLPDAEITLGSFTIDTVIEQRSDRITFVIPELADDIYPVLVISPRSVPCEFTEGPIPTATNSWSTLKQRFDG